MKSRFVVLLAVLALAMSMPAFADSINLLGAGSNSNALLDSFPAGTYYSNTYGPNLIESSTWNPSGLSTYMYAYNVTTVGFIEKFSTATLILSGGGFPSSRYLLSNATFNSSTDIFTGTFLIGGTTYHFAETLAFGSTQYTVTDLFGSPVFTYHNGYVTKGSISTTSPVPEPGTLALFGTGIVGMAGVMRKKLSILPRCNG